MNVRYGHGFKVHTADLSVYCRMRDRLKKAGKLPETTPTTDPITCHDCSKSAPASQVIAPISPGGPAPGPRQFVPPSQAIAALFEMGGPGWTPPQPIRALPPAPRRYSADLKDVAMKLLTIAIRLEEEGQ